MLSGSEVYLMTCEVIGETDENLAKRDGVEKTGGQGRKERNREHGGQDGK